ncbi:hypothetical protein [Nocardia altamirensis]|uniref:hypothetical protein n=1 Tax=Nocardia altamirensis TaxID=472158 RepID=UPI0008400FA1|nr:hypothetical protein [Nocardia altamirensis]
MSKPSASGHDCDWLPPELEAVALRLARADAAALELARLVSRWSARGPLGLTQIERVPGSFDIEVTAIRPVPPLVGMLFSEAVHHLRSAMENTLYFLVEQARGSSLPEDEAKRIEMPVLADAAAMARWHTDKARRVPELGAATVLGRRIASLQPHCDPSTVPSIDTRLAALMGITPVVEAPLVLLQRYSNVDKHRSIRVGVARSMFNMDSAPAAARTRQFEPIEVGMVLETVPKGTLEFAEAQTAVVVERPDGMTMVAPAAELSRLHRHVAEVVIPTLVKGVALTRSLPPSMDLSDTGETARERLQAGAWDYAHDRFADEAAALYEQASREPALFLDTQS